MKKNNKTLARRTRVSRHLPVRRDAGGKRHTILTVFHVLIAFVLVGLILIHLGKGTDAGAAFGSGDRRPDIDGGKPVIGVGVEEVSSATDSRVDGYVPKTEYEKLKREVENEKLKREVENERLRREVETLKGHMQRLLAAAATPESKPSAAETKEEKQPVASAPPSSQERVGRSEREEFEAEKGDRRKEAEEAKRELDQFLRAQKLLFKPGEVQLEFGASYAHEAETRQVSPSAPVFISRSASANFLMRYGLAEDLEFNFAVPLVYTELERDTRPFTFTEIGEENTPLPSFTRETGVGLGDVNWALRYAAIHEARGLPEVTLNVNAKSDTGDEDRGLGTGDWNVGTGVSLVKTIDPVVLFGSLGYTWTLGTLELEAGDFDRREPDSLLYRHGVLTQ